jgi:hypothetical protein
VGFPARVITLMLACLCAPAALANSTGQKSSERPGRGGPADPLEIVLPLEMQASLFHSLPIAGLMVTPDSIAQLVLLNPRLRATTGQPSSGNGTAYPINESGVVDTRADPSD